MISQSYKLNLIPLGVPVIVKASQYDKESRTINFTIYNGDVLFEIPSGSDVVVLGTKKDNTGFEYACTYDGSTVSFDIKDQMTVLSGEYQAEIRISNNGEILGTANFSFFIERSALTDDTIISETELPLIEEAIQKAEEIEQILVEKMDYVSDPTDGNILITDENGQAVDSGLNIDYVYGHKFGFKRHRTDSNPSTRITYIGENEDYTPFSYDFTNNVANLGSWGNFIEEVCRPVMVNYDGTVAYELDRNDTTKKADGTASDISNSSFNGNAMVEFRKYRYVSRKTVGDYDYVYFSDHKLDDTYFDYPFWAENGDIKDTFYFSMFDGSYDGTRMRSIADGEIMRDTNASTEMERTKLNGDGWNMGAWSQLNYIWDLLTLISKSDNLQASFGQGISTYSWNDGVNPFGWIVGQSKNKGAFFGESAGQNVVRTLYIEDLWGRAWDRYNGLILYAGTFKVKNALAYPTPTDTSSTYSDYTSVGTAPNEGYVIQAQCGEYGYIPESVGGSATTYYCDYFYRNTSGVRFAIVGGPWHHGGKCGRYVNLYNSASRSSADLGSRLSLV